MIRVWVVRSDSGTEYCESRMTAAEVVLNAVERHGNATMWTKLVSQEFLATLDGPNHCEAARRPPTEKQLNYLRGLGYEGAEMKTLEEARALIAEMVKARSSGTARDHSGLAAEQRDRVRSVGCPSCGATAGRLCRTSGGHPHQWHAARVRLALID